MRPSHRPSGRSSDKGLSKLVTVTQKERDFVRGNCSVLSDGEHGAGFVAPKYRNHGFTALRLQVSQNGVGHGDALPAKAQRIAMELSRTKIVRPARASSCRGWSCPRACDYLVVAPGCERRPPAANAIRRQTRLSPVRQGCRDCAGTIRSRRANLDRGLLLGRRHRLYLFEQVAGMSVPLEADCVFMLPPG